MVRTTVNIGEQQLVPRGGLSQHNRINVLPIGGTAVYPAKPLGFLALCPTTNTRVRGALPSNENELLFPKNSIVATEAFRVSSELCPMLVQ
jgi:hypothetical protein